MTTTAPRTLADQIRYCADQLTTATLLDRPNIVAATLRDLAEKARETETQRDRLASHLEALVRTFYDKGHPGEPCLRSGWVPVRQIAEARQALALARPAAEVPQPSEAGRCPECGDWVYLDSRDRIGRHPVGPAGTAIECPGVGTEPEARRPLNAGPRPDGPQRHAAAPAAAETDTEPRQDGCEPQEAAQAAPDRCACGAPAALVVGYRGERGPELQCVRCATADPRAAILHGWPADGYRAIRRQQHPAPPACPGCGMPETNCACG